MLWTQLPEFVKDNDSRPRGRHHADEAVVGGEHAGQDVGYDGHEDHLGDHLRPVPATQRALGASGSDWRPALPCLIKARPRSKAQPLWRVILHLRIPGTIPGGYPEYQDQLRGGVLTMGVKTKS